MFIGLVLLAVGAIALLIQLGVLTGSTWSYFWPVLLIILGLVFLFRRSWRGGCCGGHWHSRQDEDKK
ncbi:MAG: DUF5668 domain-containing protein [Chloroflexota bacterium]|jgi:hypothetical protein